MKLVESILTHNPCYTAGRKISVKGLMPHSVGCAQPNASVFINAWSKESYNRACVHGFIDGNSGIIYQTLPWNHRGWHAGASANNTHIGVEMCEPSAIRYTGGANFTVTDKAAAVASAKRTYQAAVELFAFLCKQFNLNPLQKGVIVSHKEGCALGIASNHGDPEHLWCGLGLNYTMDTFRKAVQEAMNSPTKQPENDGKEETEVRYNKLQEVKYDLYRKTLEKLISKGILAGKGGEGEERIIDLSEDSVRILVYLDRAGVFDD